MNQKEMKGKLAAVAGCLIVFAALLIWKVSGDRTPEEKEPLLPSGAVTLEEVYRLLPETKEIEGFPGEESTWLTKDGLNALFA